MDPGHQKCYPFSEHGLEEPEGKSFHPHVLTLLRGTSFHTPRKVGALSVTLSVIDVHGGVVAVNLEPH